jgi:hypothetical protein
MITLNPIDYSQATMLLDKNLTDEQIELVSEIVENYTKDKQVDGSIYIKFRKLIIENL